MERTDPTFGPFAKQFWFQFPQFINKIEKKVLCVLKLSKLITQLID